MSKQQIASGQLSNLGAALATLKEQSEKNRKAAEYFKSVDTVYLRPRGSVRTSETVEAKAIHEFRAPTVGEGGEVVWANIKAKATERKLRVTRFCDELDAEGRKVGEILLVATVRTYEDAKGTVVGVSPKNSRFRAEVITGKELLRAHGHRNEWEHDYKGTTVKTMVFNANGIGLLTKESQFAVSQEQALKDAMAKLPELETIPE